MTGRVAGIVSGEIGMASPVLVEREDEVAALEAAIRRTASGEGGMVAIGGPAGIGKTRLVEAVLGMASAHGVTTLVAAGSPLEQGLPYATIGQALTGIARNPETLEVLLAGRASAASSLLGAEVAELQGERTVGVLDGLFWATVNLTEQRPLVIAIDDGHWVDPPTLRFLSYLARRIEGLAALLVYAHRPGGASEPVRTRRSWRAPST